MAAAASPPALLADSQARRRRRGYDGLIVDLDGVIWLGSRPIEGAADAIARLRANGTRVVFLTNDPHGSQEEQAARLSAPASPLPPPT